MTDKGSANRNDQAWGLPNVLDYFGDHRITSNHVYPSEWVFLRDRLREGVNILDVGCAQGGFAGIVAEHVKDFDYTGVDINEEMIKLAKERFSSRNFAKIEEGDLSLLADAKFNLVLVLGILHLHESWRQTLAEAWKHCADSLIFDLRETHQDTIEDKDISYFKMNFGDGDDTSAAITLPYNFINAAEAEEAINSIFHDAAKIEHYGYRHPLSESAVSPEHNAITRTWCVTR
jgi:SAM-dependent methyltransferase